MAVNNALSSTLLAQLQLEAWGANPATGSAKAVTDQITDAIAASAIRNAGEYGGSAEASLGSGLAEINSVQGQDNTQITNAQAQLTNLQSANLPQVLANYSETVTALQAAELAFGRIQNLTLFSVLH